MSNRIWMIALLVLALGLLLSACGPYPAASTPIPTLAPRQVTPAPAEATAAPSEGGEPAAAAISLEEAAQVFAANCAGCHGENGQNGQVGPSLAMNADIQQMGADGVHDILHDGVAGTAMQSYASILSDAEIEGLVNLVMSWQEEGAAIVETTEAPAAEPTGEPTAEPAESAGVDLETAAATFERECQVCHGANGQNAAVGPDLAANPNVGAMTDAQIHNILLNGVAGTAMQSFADRLSAEELAGMVALIRSWQSAGAAAPEPTAAPTEAAGGRAVAEADLDAGLEAFSSSCAGCHGADGMNGAVGPALHPNADVAAMKDEEIRDILHNGIAGTAMPGFAGKLSDEQVANLVAVIRSWQE